MRGFCQLFCVVILLVCGPGCRRDVPEVMVESVPTDAVAQVGGAWILQSDVDYYIRKGWARDDASALRRLIEESHYAEAARVDGFERTVEGRAAIRRLLATRYLEAQSVEVQVSEEELRGAWERSGDRFRQAARLELAALRQQFVGADGRAEALRRLNEAREHYLQFAQTPALRGFGVLAPRYSDEPNTRYQGGMLGWVVEGQKHLLIPEAVSQAFFESPELGLADAVVVHADTAWLFLVTQVEAPRLSAFEDVRDELERELRAQKQAAAKLQLCERAEEVAPVQVLVDLPQYEGVSVEPIHLKPPSL